MGRIDCDLIIKNARYLDVFSCTWKEGDLAIIDGTIVGNEPGLKARRVIDALGRPLVPGFIDAHVHVESSLLIPNNFEKAVLPRGTTTAVCDPHEITNVTGVAGLKYFLEAASKLSIDLRVMLSSCVPATHLETNGAGTLAADKLVPLREHPKALGLAEMMNVPGILNKDPNMLGKLEAFSDKVIDGHCPLLSGASLSAYASTGVTSCHESSRLSEAAEKLSKGVAVWIREGSVAKDLRALAPLLTLSTSTSVGFCTDDRNPLDIATEGHIDHLVRQSIRYGVAPEVAYRSASWTVARHYGLDRGLARAGAIAPGYAADLVLLDDARSCAVAEVFKRGISAREIGHSGTMPRNMLNTVRAAVPEAKDLEGPPGQVHVIGVRAGRILTDRSVTAHDAPGVARLSVLERHGHGGAPANAYVTGFGSRFRGAIASSVGHDSHNLIVVGDRTDDMRYALAALIDCGGGFCVARDRGLLARLELPFGGLMSGDSHEDIEKKLRELHRASHMIGCELPEPFLQLAFLSLPVIPTLKLTDKGLVDVDLFRVIPVRAV
ncbi:MAG: adenine deaminase [Deltaproteobacteria bacterium]|nr:adenine deaminase [Deltaproteobacteria bacterium]